MSIGKILQSIIIEPIRLIFEFIFGLAYRVTGANALLAIISLSIIVNLVIYPLYKKADELQEKQKEKENKLKPSIDHIKKTFKGDEAYMMLQTLYRQNDYSPLSVLNGSVSLLLQIPFFMAAYQFLHDCPALEYSFGIFKNLSKPDAMLRLGSFDVNVLPIAMTLINLVSVAIYTKGQKFKDKIQLLIMALFFLVFLYDSPSGLVFYWLLNNVFSLVKTLYKNVKNKFLAISVTCLAVSLVLLVSGLFIHPLATVKRKIGLIILCCGLCVPMILYAFRKYIPDFKIPDFSKEDEHVFTFSALLNTALVGALIPSAMVASSPGEFVNLENIVSPSFYVVNSTLIAGGLFILWLGIFYYLSNNTGKKVVSMISLLISTVALIDYMGFGKDLGVILPTMVFEEMFNYSMMQKLVNLAVLFVGCLAVMLVWYRKKQIITIALLSGALAIGAMSVVNLIKINGVVKNIKPVAVVDKDKVSFNMSTNGKNTVVIMLDRAISCYVPYIFQEKPELYEKYDGFTYYPNAVSYGVSTNFGIPTIYGGYEYTPEEMNKRENELLADKHDESLKVTPYLLSENGFNVTLFDPSYAGYDNVVPDLSIFDDNERISSFITQGMYNELRNVTSEHIWDRNFVRYGLFKATPVLFQELVYDKGEYWEFKYSEFTTIQVAEDEYHATGVKNSFTDAYDVLRHLGDLTVIKNDDSNNCLMMTSMATHEPMLLQLPDYTVSEVVDNSAYVGRKYVCNGREITFDNSYELSHYHVDAASLIILGKWFDFLKEKGVWDNTKIIIVSDHGRGLNQIPEFVYDKKHDFQNFNCLLMVKDYDANGFITSDEFMTTADVPTLALKDNVYDPVNPFTGKPINSDEKKDGVTLLYSEMFDITINNGKKFMPGDWFSVHDDIFNPDNWQYLGNH